MDPIIAQKFDRAVRLVSEASLLLEQIKPFIQAQPEVTQAQPTRDLDKKLRMLLHSDKWPLAVEKHRLCDINSDADKLARANAILDQVVDVSVAGKRFLDFGCGEGHVPFASIGLGAEVAVGYDLLRQGWGQFPNIPSLILTSELAVADEYAPFDIILIHDVLDHCLDPIETLEEAKQFLADDGRICVKCHPWCSRHGGHNYHGINRAYAQLFFPEGEGQRVMRPFEEYREWFAQAGLEIRYERPSYGEIPKFFQMSNYLSDKLKAIYDSEEFPDEFLRIESVTYTLSKQLNS